MYVRCASLLLLLLSLDGCFGGLGKIEHMTPEQIKEMAKIKDANITCIELGSPYGKGHGVFLNLDKGVILDDGIVTIDDACKVTINSGVKPPASKKEDDVPVKRVP